MTDDLTGSRSREARDAEEDDALHTGDDERIDLVTSILAACDALGDDDEDVDQVVQGIREDCERLDALLLATIAHEQSDSSTLAAVTRARDALQAENKALKAELARVEPSSPRAAPTGTTAEQPMGNAEDAKRTEAWQPIETAPTDRGFLVAYNADRDVYGLVCWWPGGGWNGDGCWGWQGESIAWSRERGNQPTHWMPLVAFPTTRANNQA